MSDDNLYLGIKKNTFQEVFKNSKHQQIIISDSLRYKNLYESSNSIGISNLVGNFLGHFIYYFLEWVLYTAKKNGITKLYFTSRDTKLMYECIKIIIEKRNLNIEIEYFYVSRQAITLASVINYTKSDFLWLERYFDLDPLVKILKRLDLKFSDIEPFINQKKLNWNPQSILSDLDAINLFWEFMFKPEIEIQITKNIEFRRVKTIAYFNSIGLLDSNNFAMIDLGWFKSIQLNINKIIQTTSSKTILKGIYLGVFKDRFEDAITGDSFSLFYQENEREPNEYVFKNITLLEYIIGICNNGSVIGYEYNVNNEINVICEEIYKSSFEFYSIVEIELIKFFNTKVLDINTAYISDYDTQVILNGLLTVFVEYPSQDLLHEIKNIKTTSFLSNEESNNLLTPISLLTFLFNKKKKYNNIVYWPKANIMISNKIVQLIYYLYNKIN